MTILRVQSKRASVSSTLSTTVTLDADPVPGNALLIAYRESGDPAVVNLNTGGFSLAGPLIGPTGRFTAFMYKVCNSLDRAYTISSDLTNTKTIVISEVSGLGLALPKVQNNGDNTATVTTGDTGTTGVLPKPNCYVMAVENLSGSSGGTNAIDSGFSLLQTAVGLSDTFLVADLITSATTALNANWTWLTARTEQGAIAVFQEADPIVPATVAPRPLTIPMQIARRRRIR